MDRQTEKPASGLFVSASSSLRAEHWVGGFDEVAGTENGGGGVGNGREKDAGEGGGSKGVGGGGDAGGWGGEGSVL